MKKTSFLKGLTMAAVAMVCAFTTSCSEEELKIQGGTIEIPEVPELAAPVASLAITVLDFENNAKNTRIGIHHRSHYAFMRRLCPATRIPRFYS